jgi:putative transposase
VLQPSPLYKRHRFPGEIISHAVWHRAENSHRPTRRRERVLQRFKSPAHAQQFLAPFGPISDHVRPRRHRLPAPGYRHTLQTRFAAWREVTGLPAAA